MDYSSFWLSDTYIYRTFLSLRMDYHSSPKTWSTSSSPTFTYSSSSTYSVPDETPSIKYYSDLANTEKQYISPYANERTTAGSSRSQARSASVLSTSNLRSLETKMSSYSTSSQSSSTYSSPRSTKNAMSSSASSSKKMSSVSPLPSSRTFLKLLQKAMIYHRTVLSVIFNEMFTSSSAASISGS